MEPTHTSRGGLSLSLHLSPSLSLSLLLSSPVGRVPVARPWVLILIQLQVSVWLIWYVFAPPSFFGGFCLIAPVIQGPRFCVSICISISCLYVHSYIYIYIFKLTTSSGTITHLRNCPAPTITILLALVSFLLLPDCCCCCPDTRKQTTWCACELHTDWLVLNTNLSNTFSFAREVFLRAPRVFVR